MEWEAPGIVLSARPFGEGDAIAATFTEGHGRHLGLARGGSSRRHAAIWQPGNVVQLRWTGRLADQLGGFTAELVHPAAALAMDDALTLAILNAGCAVADGALAEREPHARAFAGLLRMVGSLAEVHTALIEAVRWEVALLAELGYGLDLSRCALGGETAELAFVSPKSGRAVSRDQAGAWRDRLLRLPAFVWRDAPATCGDIADGLTLTGHFLAHMVFGLRHQPLPAARVGLQDRVVARAQAVPTRQAMV